jgi:hypothetical protein
MSNVLVALLGVVLMSSSIECRGAGRAFPIDSEEYAISTFRTINPNIEWDPTNFLVDMAGNYANCESAGQSARSVAVDGRTTPEGQSIGGVVDSIEAPRVDADAVNGYVKTTLDGWMRRGTFDSLVRGANKFGCSIRPGCRGAVRTAVVACLFSPGSGGRDWQEDEPEAITEVRALAFTPEQYKIAEQYTGKVWDRSHMLENLSGMETSCSMIGQQDWPFRDLRTIGERRGRRINPVYGWAANLGSTQTALDEILGDFKQMKSASELGCSLIPDCMIGREMFVVVTCLYLDELH